MPAYRYGRFSGLKQEKGNSTVRQIELAQEWCARKGIPLDETLSFFDKGISSFRGKNRKRGGLSVFLAACKAGRVARGSYLLVESLDRLSREQLHEGQQLIRDLLFTYGIKVVTLLVEMEFTAENYEQTHWLIDAEFTRAHSESRTKSIRSLDNWRRRRESLSADNPLTAKLPAWVVQCEGKLVEDKPRADVVRRIFDLAARGFGQRSIVRRLRRDKVPPIGKALVWHESYVQKILHARAVLGEFQPKQIVDGDRVPVGQVVKDYFPRVISDEQWAAARAAMGARRLKRGRVTARVSNLFTGVVYDLDGRRCAMRGTKGVRYLQSAECETPGVRYDTFERAFLWWVKEVQVNVANGGDYAALKARADQLDRSCSALRAKIDADPSMIDMIDTLAKWRGELADVRRQMEAAAVPLQTHYLHAQRLVKALEEATEDERETLRREVRLAVSQVVERVTFSVESAPDRKTKRVAVDVQMKDGQVYAFAYAANGGRILNGIAAKAGPDGATVEASMTPDAPSDADAGRREKIETCIRMRREGASYKQITEATGWHRVTISEHLRAAGLTQKK